MDGEKDLQGRSRLQNYVSMPEFLTETLWQNLGSEDRVPRLQLQQDLADHLVLLGLRYPSEPTLSMAYVLVHYKKDAHWKTHSNALYADLTQFKAEFKACLVRSRGCLHIVPGPYMVELPISWEHLPEDVLERVFDGGVPAMKPVEKEVLLRYQALIPLRNTSLKVDKRTLSAYGSMAPAHGVSVVKALTDFFQMMQSQKAPSSGATLTMASGENLALEASIPAHSNQYVPSKEARCLPIANPPEASVAVVPAAAVATSVSAGTVSPVAEAMSANPANEKAPLAMENTNDGKNSACNEQQAEKPLANVLDRLQESLQERNENKAKEKKERSPKAKASKGKALGKGKQQKKKAIPKRKAAKSQVKFLGKVQKKKVTNTKPLKPEKRKKGLDPVIPPALKVRYRDGCSRCRYRKGCTPSCWQQRGYLLIR